MTTDRPDPHPCSKLHVCSLCGRGIYGPKIDRLNGSPVCHRCVEARQLHDRLDR